MGDLRAERAPAAPVGRGHPRPILTLTDAQSAAAKRGGVCLSDPLARMNSKTSLQWRCGAGHEWDASLNSVRNHGTWCPQCAGIATLSLADACSVAAERGGVCLSDTYSNCRTPLHANLLCEQICGGAGPATSGAQLSEMSTTVTRGVRSVRALRLCHSPTRNRRPPCEGVCACPIRLRGRTAGHRCGGVAGPATSGAQLST
jgi:Probable Zinc-ribbon domain